MKKIGVNSIYFLLGILLSVLFVELFFRATEIKIPFKTLDKKRGKTYLPNTKIHYHVEALFLAESNAMGYINHSVEKNPFRIVFYGDSFTEAHQVKTKYNFVSRTKALLEDYYHKKVSTYNLGISNVLMNDIYIRKKAFEKTLKPNLSIYFVDNIQFVRYQNGVLNSLQLLQENNQLKIVESQQKAYQWYKKFQPVIDNSALITLGLENYLSAKKNGFGFSYFWNKQNNQNIFDTQISQQKEQLLHENINLILQEIANENHLFVIKERINESTKQVFEKHKIRYIETYDVLDALRKKGINPYYWPRTEKIGHFNKEAHEAIAKKIVANIK